MKAKFLEVAKILMRRRHLLFLLYSLKMHTMTIISKIIITVSKFRKQRSMLEGNNYSATVSILRHFCHLLLCRCFYKTGTLFTLSYSLTKPPICYAYILYGKSDQPTLHHVHVLCNTYKLYKIQVVRILILSSSCVSIMIYNSSLSRQIRKHRNSS